MSDSERPARVQPVPLGRLLGTPIQVPVSGVSFDSRRVRPGDVYVGLPGENTHGARFAAAVARAGAVALVTDQAGADLAAGELPVIVVADPRRELARLAALLYGRPSDRLAMFAVTGTAGKTSTSFLVAAALSAAGYRTGTIGTIGFRLDGEALDQGRSTVTTPEASDLQALLAVMVERGADAVAMEVSSHALALHRADWIDFDVAAFTNLGHDHLDFHHDQESYYRAKSSLFLTGRVRHAVVNIDDPWGARLAAEITAQGQAVLHTTGATGDYRILSRDQQAEGRSRVRIATPEREVEFTLAMIGDFNVHNALTAVAMIDVSPVNLDTALTGLSEASVPGRMQRVELGEAAPGVVVDFAHTPESVAAALSALPQGRRIAVLGCGGDRDQAKRGPMGAAAARAADLVIVTDDNPRQEDPALIRAAVVAGAQQAASGQVQEVPGRRAAIRAALAAAGPQGWVAVLGKGHEQGQQVGDQIIAFDDVTVVRDEWAARAVHREDS